MIEKTDMKRKAVDLFRDYLKQLETFGIPAKTEEEIKAAEKDFVKMLAFREVILEQELKEMNEALKKEKQKDLSLKNGKQINLQREG